MGFDYASHFSKGLPAPAAAPFKGFAPYYFVGGNNAPEAVKVPDLIAAATRALEKEGANLAIYNLQTGPQGYRPLREWLVGRLKNWCDMDVTPDNILMCSGSLQCLDLVHKALLVQLEQQVHKVLLEMMVHKVLLEMMVHRVLLV